MESNQISAIRRAIASGEYPRAQKLWAEYMAHLRAELRRGALTEAELKEAGEVLEWARVTVLCARAHIQNRLETLRVAAAYSAAPPAPPASRIFRTEG
jgi:hypothetical protein